jgi:hypothetical protein
MLLAEDQDVVEELSPQSAGEPSGEGVHVGCARRRADHMRADRLEHQREPPSELRLRAEMISVTYHSLWKIRLPLARDES